MKSFVRGSMECRRLSKIFNSPSRTASKVRDNRRGKKTRSQKGFCAEVISDGLITVRSELITSTPKSIVLPSQIRCVVRTVSTCHYKEGKIILLYHERRNISVTDPPSEMEKTCKPTPFDSPGFSHSSHKWRSSFCR
ncbi:hypothetical protein KP509_20G036100 [Ceratopteris richardii]|uniref:Uncharacterized protein n=1 Tax=Ceratopteris richardii TaxID=49495 RepID=A0A8T2SHQ3_CERRI|nr:hypothetical protein KP509_20G036100 [Ceratopteris richardii]